MSLPSRLFHWHLSYLWWFLPSPILIASHLHSSCVGSCLMRHFISRLAETATSARQRPTIAAGPPLTLPLPLPTCHSRMRLLMFGSCLLSLLVSRHQGTCQFIVPVLFSSFCCCLLLLSLLLLLAISRSTLHHI